MKRKYETSMSRVGKMPVELPKEVELKLDGDFVVIKGPKGSIKREVPRNLKVAVKDGAVWVTAQKKDTRTKALHGTLRAHIVNMVKGVTEGWSKSLELVGAGYRAELEGKDLVLRVGYSHPVKIDAPEGLTIKVEKNDITLESVDKELVGKYAAIIRKVRPPEPYKGKGIKYKDEVIKRKAGKAAKAQAAA